MKKLLLILLLTSPCYAEGPLKIHKDASINLEFQNVYLDLRNVSATSSGDYATLSGTQTFTGLNTFTGVTTLSSGTFTTEFNIGSQSSVFKARSTGEVTQPLQPSFLATDGTGAVNVTGDDTTYTELWPTEVYDQGSDFASNTFTAPVTGKYLLSVSVRLENIAVTHTGARVLRIVTSNRTYAVADQQTLAAASWTPTLAVVADMDSGDTATITLSVGTTGKTVDVSAGATTNHFSGSLIN